MDHDAQTEQHPTYTDLVRHDFFGGPVARPGRSHRKTIPVFPDAPAHDDDHALNDDEPTGTADTEADVQSGVIIHEHYTVERGAEDFSASNVNVGRAAEVSELPMLVPVDTRRRLVRLKNVGTVAVVIGKRNALYAEQGWVLNPGDSAEEFGTTKDLYAVVPAAAPAGSTALVCVWVERDS